MIRKMSEIRCKLCNRILRSEESIKLGYGKTCYRIMKLNQTKQPEDNSDDIMFLKMEVKMLKRQIGEIKRSGIKVVDKIERLKMTDNPIKNEQKIQFNKCVSELKEIFNMEDWDYRKVPKPILPREIIENPPITHH